MNVTDAALDCTILSFSKSYGNATGVFTFLFVA